MLQNHALSFFFNDTATTEIYTLSLHDALPICGAFGCPTYSLQERIIKFLTILDFIQQNIQSLLINPGFRTFYLRLFLHGGDRKSTRLNSSHANISYAVFCLKKKKKTFHFS